MRMYLAVMWDSLILWFQDNQQRIVVGAATVGASAIIVVGGYQTKRISENKHGVIIHDQGYSVDKQRDGLFKLNVNGDLSSRSFDLINEPREFAIWIAEIGVQRFGLAAGCSYHLVIVGDSIYKFQNFNALSYHASGYNSPSIGIMLTRSDSKKLNKKTMNSLEIALAEVKDSIKVQFNSPTQYVLFHEDVAKNGKQDPHEFRPLINKRKLRYDNRPWPIRLDHVPRLELK